VVNEGHSPAEGASGRNAHLEAKAVPKSRRVRKILLIVAGFVAALGVAAGGTLFYVYDKATAIDRSTPQVVVEQFLDAALMLRDSDRIALFTCRQWSALEAAQKVGAPANPKIAPSWGDFSTRVEGVRASVDVRVYFSISVDGDFQQDIQSWTLRLEDQDGWRVCDLIKNGSVRP